MRIPDRGLKILFAVLCACTVIKFAEADDLIRNNETPETKQAFREIVDDEPSNGVSYPKKLIPIKEPRRSRNYAIRAMPLDPDAEMLPAHYTGVKPPGVDHMELRHEESRISKAVPKIEPQKKSGQSEGNQQVASELGSGDESEHEVYEKAATFENERKGDYSRTKEKSQNIEAGGKKKTEGGSWENSGKNLEEGKGNKGGKYSKGSNDHVNRKAIGYHNVYHKDEHKRDHDFYDNDDHGGHLKKHGRYNEKHVATEGKFKKGGSHNSGLEETEVRKKGVTGKSQAAEESKGHETHHGYDEFFKNFQGFVKQADKNRDEKSGFGHKKTR